MPDLVARLRAAGCVFAEDEAALLTSAASDPEDLAILVQRRIAGEPLEYVVGWAQFCGLRIALDAGVFVPRRRTQWLARQAVSVCGPSAVVVDLCCGSGAVAAAVLAGRPDAEVHAADVDPVATRCARRNLPGPVHTGDLYAALPASLRGRVQVLVVNAPYVPTDAIALMPPEARLYEARVALDGGADGLDVHRRVVAGAADWLAPGGHLLVETGVRQARVAQALFAAAGLRSWVTHDEDLDATVVLGRAAPTA